MTTALYIIHMLHQLEFAHIACISVSKEFSLHASGQSIIL